MWHIKDFENLNAAQDREAKSLRAAASAVPAAPRPAGPPLGAGGRGAGGAPPAPQPGRPSPVGAGDIDFKPIIAAWRTSGLQYFFIEQDAAAQWPGGSLGSAAISYQNLRKLLA